MTRHYKPMMGLISIGALIVLLLLISSKQARPNRGLMGIGALILFIAVILVAAIAASVLIASGGSLQQKALITGSETREGISPGLEPVSIRGADPSQSGTPHAVTKLYVLARLPAGSEALSLNNTVMKLDTRAGSQDFTYAGAVANGVPSATTYDFVVTYVKSGPYQEDDYVNRGDLVNLKLNIDGQMGENRRGVLSVIPQTGNINQLEFVTPESMVDPMVILWPTT